MKALILRQLAAYEDARLTPDPVLAKELEAYRQTGASPEWVAKAVELDREGRLVVSPPKSKYGHGGCGS